MSLSQEELRAVVEFRIEKAFRAYEQDVLPFVEPTEQLIEQVSTLAKHLIDR